MKHKHHIIECVKGKRVRTNKVITISLKEHARRHKINYDKWGFKEDYLAWQGLSGQLPKEKIIHELAVEMGKRNIKYITPEIRKRAVANARKTNKGRKLTDEHKAKIVGWGRKQPQSQKDKVRDKVSKEYIITYQGKTFEIKNLLDFCRKKKLDQGNMTKVAQKKLQSHKGYIVRYA